MSQTNRMLGLHLLLCAAISILGAGLITGGGFPGPEMRTPSRRSQSKSNMMQILMAVRNYDEMEHALPPAVVRDGEGAALYSGRVALLPYLERLDVADRFDHGKAWNSPGNADVTEAQIRPFQSPSSKGPGARTDYLFVTGPHTLFEEGRTVSLADVPDGTASTICLIEKKDSQIHWTEPKDYRIDDLKTIPPGNHPGGTLVGFADGSVQQLSPKIDPVVWRALLTRDGGEVVRVP